MARVTSSNGTAVSGRINDWVYVRYRGGTYIRKAPATKKEARTPVMLLNQQRFAKMHSFSVQFKHSLIHQIWNDAATTYSGYNLFMKTNSGAFGRDGSRADPLMLKFSVGKLVMPEDMTAERTAPEATTLKISWTKEPSISGIRSKDELMMITSNGESFSPITPTSIKRKDLEGVVELPVMPWAANYIYLFFMTEDRRDFSNSKTMMV